MARVDVLVTQTNSAGTYTGAGTNYIVQANNGNLYFVYIDAQSDVVFVKSTNDGITWSNSTNVFTGTARTVALWYGRWSGLADDKIYLVYNDDVNGDILFRTIDTASSDSLGTETTVLAGTSSAAGGALTIVVGRNGHIRVAGSIDAGAEDGAWSSTDSGATWGDTIADPSEGATQDQYFLLPGWNADTADVMLIFVDASANGLSVKRYDDSANTWGETAIVADGSFADQTASNAFPHVACFVDVANSRNIVAAWNAVDTLNADLQCWIIDDTTVTAVTDIVSNSTDDQGLVAIGIDTATSTWYAFYGGKSDGSETYNTSMLIYYKTSSDSGTTWGSETALSTSLRTSQWLACTPRFATDYFVAFYNDSVNDNVAGSAPLPASGGSANLLAGKL